ncbi:unnamed protein product, partial [Staurois parvus]
MALWEELSLYKSQLTLGSKKFFGLLKKLVLLSPQQNQENLGLILKIESI